MIYSNDQYFEAKIQIRPNKKIVTDFLKQLIDKDPNCLISKEITNKYGIDYLVTSRKSAIKLAKNLKKKFNGEVKVSKTLFGMDRQKSKKIYRVTVLFRLA